MPQHFIEHLPAPLPQRPDGQLHQPRGVPLADPVGLLCPTRRLATRTRPYSFFVAVHFLNGQPKTSKEVRTTPGSSAPGLMPMQSPSSAVNPMVLSTLFSSKRID